MRKIQCIVLSAVLSSTYIPMFGQDTTFDNIGISNIVATIAGYQVLEELGSEITVPTFSMTFEKNKVRGMLFYVVRPTNLAGHYFILMGDMPFFRSQPLYEKGKLYCFNFSSTTNSDTNISLKPDHIFYIPPKTNLFLHIETSVLGYRYFISVNEAQDFLSDINIKLLEKENLRKEAKTASEREFQKIKQSGKTFKKGYRPENEVYNKHIDIETTIDMEIGNLKSQKANVVKQLEAMNTLRNP